MIERRDAGAWKAELDGIIEAYRARLRDGDAAGISLEDAIARCKKLGLTRGEALVYLRPKRGWKP